MTGEVARHNENPLGYEPIRKLLVKFAVPAIVSMLVNALYNIVDQIFIGRGVGYLGNAATTVAFPVFTITLAIGTLLGGGASAYAAIKLGEKKNDIAEKTLGNMFTLTIITGVFLSCLCFLFFEPMLKLFGATENVMYYAKEYTSIILFGTPFMMVGIGLSNMARTDGAPKLSMYSMLAGAILNTILDPIYIFVFHWGVTGAAIATITSQIISASVVFWYFIRKGNMRIRKKYLKPEFKLSVSFATLGISSCIVQSAATLLQIAMNNSLVYYGNLSEVGGDIALSAMGIVMKVNAILIGILVGISMGSQPILGFNKGARRPKRIYETYKTAVLIGSAVALLGWASCMFIPEVILGWFGDSGEKFMQFGTRCMSVYLAGIFTAGFQIISTGYFQATGQPLKASILSLLRQIIFLIPLIFILPLFFGLDGILYAGPVADISSALIVAAFIGHEIKKLKVWISEYEEDSNMF
ncbi:MAG: MATE family efflux transporter [Lachnospiraceae bacterium]|nr:MATE family efflux transporter [Lachnospiraceae bacterium]